jgi:hypothetical protein
MKKFQRKRKTILAMKVAVFTLMNGFLYNLVLNDILRRCALENEHKGIMEKAHVGPMGGHYQEDNNAINVLQASLWWPTLQKYCQSKVKKCDILQWMGRPLRRDEITLHLIKPCLSFDIWGIQFVGPFPQRAIWKGEKYIITPIKYLTKWVEAELVDSCTK